MALCMAACQYDPNSQFYVTTKPADSDVAGTYKFARQQVDVSAAISGTPVINLSADHTFEMTDFPQWTEKSPAVWKLAGSRSFKGTWNIEQVGSLADGSGKTKPIFGIRFTAGPDPLYANLTLDGSQRGLLFGFGDPDNGASMAYDKIK
jgi:hypothetical protein